MKLLLYIAAFMVGAIDEAAAQQLVVRSGDHPNFSRITVPLEPQQEWSATRNTEGIEIALENYEGDFDTRDVFLRMKRERIEALFIGDSTLNIAFSCDCEATAFRSGSLLVIDVADAGTALAGPPIRNLFEYNNQASAQARSLELGPTGLRHWYMWQDGKIEKSPRLGAGNQMEQPDAPRDQTRVLNDTQSQLVRQIAGATSAGLLTETIQPSTGKIIDRVPRDTGPTTQPPQLKPLIRETSNLSISGSMDTPLRKSLTWGDIHPEPIACGARQLNVESWGDDTSFASQLAVAREQLVDARDIADEDAILALVKTYLYFGFGAEAGSVLSLHKDAALRMPELSGLAQIFDEGKARPPNPFSGATNCNSEWALWSILSQPPALGNPSINSEAALIALNKLPVHLRTIVAPLLARRFRDANLSTAAKAALRSLERVPDYHGTAHQNIDPIAAPAGDLLSSLGELISHNRENAPLAIIEQIQEKQKREDTISAETVELIQSYTQEYRGTEEGLQLLKNQVLAHSLAGQFTEALAKLHEIETLINLTDFQALHSAILGRLVKKSSDTEFLEYVFSEPSIGLAKVDRSIFWKMSERLLGLGFVVEAQTLLAQSAGSEGIAEAQILEARIALAMRQPLKAQAALLQLDGESANLLRAEARQMAGAPVETPEPSNTPSAIAARNRRAPETLGKSLADIGAAPVFEQFAQLDNRSEPDSAVGLLQGATTTLDNSEQTRNAIEQLLNDPIVTVLPD